MCNKDSFNPFIRKQLETKYLIEKRKTLDNNLILSKIIDEFLSKRNKDELLKFLNSQNFIKVENAEQLSYLELKEKIAYELNELILKLGT
jgi:hypothetical protein